MYRFSDRTKWPRLETALAAQHREHERAGNELLDLTCSNPTRQGFIHEPDLLRTIFSNACHYRPEALGLACAREAIASYYRARNAWISPERIWIGAGTSELYAHSMSILCDPDDVWLVPRPGYPLFDYVADLTGVRTVPYPLDWDGAWHVRAAALEAVLDANPGTRAIVTISPHNPTGHVWSDSEFAHLVACCAEREIALIIDEVFLDYPMSALRPPRSRAGEPDCLTICLSGISKAAAFPQGKLAWAAVSGPVASVNEFLARAELVADTFLNASPVIQAGLPQLLEAAPTMQRRIAERCRANLLTAQRIFRDTPASILDTQAGWTALLRMPCLHDDAHWASLVLQKACVLTHPGYLFGMDAVHTAPFLALSLLVSPPVIEPALERLAGLVQAI